MHNVGAVQDIRIAILVNRVNSIPEIDTQTLKFIRYINSYSFSCLDDMPSYLSKLKKQVQVNPKDLAAEKIKERRRNDTGELPDHKYFFGSNDSEGLVIDRAL